ncbi:MAG: beta-glucosidase BglX [Bacteroides sp.]
MKKILIALICLISIHAYADSDKEMKTFIDQLMSRMTLKEKIGQLNLPGAGDVVTGEASSDVSPVRFEKGEIGGLLNLKGVDRIRAIQEAAVKKSRLGIPLIFGMDVIHGYETVFPIPLGLSCSWNLEAIKKTARIAAIEATADGIGWTFSPMVDISHDARWGRVAEGSGEDSYLGSQIAKAMVEGYQTDDLTRKDAILACVKHFALYGAPEAGRDYNSVDMSRIRMFNEYMMPYKAAVDAGAGSVMASFNDVDGVPATGSRWLMTDVLRTQWGFNGFVVTDYTGIPEMVAHGIGNMEQVTRQALKAGIDMDMVSDCFTKYLQEAVERGELSVDYINQACRRILEAKYKLGLFKDPYKYCDPKRRAKSVFTKEHRDFARQIAAESCVLLKNDQHLLPLKKQGKIAVVGPLANTSSNMVGTWSIAARENSAATLIAGLKSVVGKKADIVYAKGSNLMHDAAYEERATLFGRSLGRDQRSSDDLLKEALAVAQQSDVIIAALGESSEMSGESSSRTNLELPDAQRELLQALLKTGKPVVLVLFTGRPLVLSWESENVPAILNAWFGGTEAAYAIGDVLFGDVNPSGKLTTSFPRNVGQVPLFYAHKNTGRPLLGKSFEKFRSNYLDVSNTPLYPFGYGLSYTTFEYSPITLSAQTMNINQSLTATVTVTNSGPCAGTEVVQLYLKDEVGSITRPVKELKGFQKITLKAGESKEITFTIDSEMLKFYNGNLDFVCEPGDFQVMIGTNSESLQTTKFSLQ